MKRISVHTELPFSAVHSVHNSLQYEPLVQEMFSCCLSSRKFVKRIANNLQMTNRTQESYSLSGSRMAVVTKHGRESDGESSVTFRQNVL
jgi:hypothetical protein